MKRVNKYFWLTLLMITTISLGACNRSTCPTFDDTARVGSAMPKKSKTKSGVIPKDFDSSKKKATKTDKKKPTNKKKKWK